jgi:hypothetical protein
MRTYIIIDRSLCDRAPITNILIHTPNSILGRIIAKSPAAATKILPAQLKLEEIIAVLYNSQHLTDDYRSIADSKPLLAQQQPNHPRKGGRIRQGTQQNLTLVLSDKAYQNLRALPSMGKFVSQLVEHALHT